MDSKNQLDEMTKKMEELDKKLGKEIFANPIKDIQEKMRVDLIEFKNIFKKNLENLALELEKGTSLGGTGSTRATDEEIQDLKVAYEHKKYQVEILKREFSNYEKKAEEEITDLKTENAKLKYRIKMLLNTIDTLEKQNH